MVVEKLITLLGFDVDVSGSDLIEKALKGIIALGASAATALAALVARSANWAAEVQRASIQTGESVENLQAMEFTANQLGLELDDLTDAFKDLNERASEAARGAGEEASEGFGLLGISVRDANGELKHGLPLFREVVGALGQMDNVALQTDAAIKIFSDTGFKLLPLLDKEGRGLNDLLGAFEALGVTLDSREIKQLDRLRGTFLTILSLADGLGKRLSVSLAPGIQDVLDGTLAYLSANKELIQSGLENFFREVAELTISLGQALFSLIRGARDAVDALGGVDKVLAGIKTVLIFVVALLGVKLVGAFLAGTASALGFVRALTLVQVRALAAQAAVFLIPAAIAAVITAVALVIEDIYRWTQGQESLVGQLLATDETFRAFVETMSLSEETMDAILEWFAGAGETIDRWIDSITRAAGALADFFGIASDGPVDLGDPPAPPTPAEVNRQAAQGVANGAQAAGGGGRGGVSMVNTFNMGNNTYSLGGGETSPAAMSGLVDRRDQDLTGQFRGALQSLSSGEEY